jgi:hypothetical protein
VQQAYARACLYRLEPQCMVLIDNENGFGAKETLVFDPSRRIAPAR